MKIETHHAKSAGKAATPRVGLLRLERLATILEKAHARYKRIGAILTGNYKEWDDEADAPAQVEGYDQSELGHNCGTPACAFGHYAFNTPQRFGWSYTGSVLAAPEFKAIGPWIQAEHEFCLTIDEVGELFGGGGCGQPMAEDGSVDLDNLITAKDAAKYIRKFVAKKRKALGLKKSAKKA